MNIFFLSLNPRDCARFHCDKHCVKMILEACQMLWTAFHLTGVDGWGSTVPEGIKIYKPTHRNHPTAVWVRSSTSNFQWTAFLAFCLCEEYTRRYGKKHACQNMARWFMKNYPQCNDSSTTVAIYPVKHVPKWCTPPPLAMPPQYHSTSLVKSYRDYYIGDKRAIAQWKYCEQPSWFGVEN